MNNFKVKQKILRMDAMLFSDYYNSKQKMCQSYPNKKCLFWP